MRYAKEKTEEGNHGFFQADFDGCERGLPGS